MDRSARGKLVGTLKNRQLVSVAVLLACAVCLQLIGTLNSGLASVRESEYLARNHAASKLYAKLATLPQPTSTSEVTIALHRFIRQTSTAQGVTLLDAHGNLVAQLGDGNESLTAGPGKVGGARIPIKSNGQLFGHAVLAFESDKHTVGYAFRYVALATVSMTLLWMLGIHAMTLYRVLVRQLRHP